MWRKVIAMVLALTVPAVASAGPLKNAVEKAGRDLAAAQSTETQDRGRGRFWMSIALIGGGGALATLGGLELGESESGQPDSDDADGSEPEKTRTPGARPCSAEGSRRPPLEACC